MSWSAEKQRMLGAMGFEMLVQAPSVEPPPVAAPAAPAAPVQQGTGALACVDDHAVLRRALQRASGGRDLTGLADDLERLRREPGLKRALWLRLRTLLRNA